MGANIGTALLIVVVLFLGSSAWGQDLVKAVEPTPTHATNREFSSSKADPMDLLASASAGPLANPEPLLAAAPIEATPIRPITKTDVPPRNESRNTKIWYSLAAVNHGAAAFDAWSTRNSIQHGAKELNPLLKPFANSNAIYASIQVMPFGMDYLGRRMMRSHNPVVRKMWWLPQTASAAISIAAGIHNVGVTSR